MLYVDNQEAYFFNIYDLNDGSLIWIFTNQNFYLIDRSYDHFEYGIVFVWHMW